MSVTLDWKQARGVAETISTINAEGIAYENVTIQDDGSLVLERYIGET